MNTLANKIALITGGNSGIGLATAKLFKNEGATVIITARNKDTFEKAKKELGHQFEIIQTDVSDISSVNHLFNTVKEKFGNIDILFANAGIALLRPTAEVDPEFFDNHFNTNVRGLYFTVQKALPLLNKNSKVILNASVLNIKGLAGASVYSATKAAVRSFARSWTAEIPVDQVRFNVLSPGLIETPIYSKLGMPKDQLDAFATNMANSVPIKRFGSADEIAKVALFLASDNSSYIAGAEIMADGGFTQV